MVHPATGPTTVPPPVTVMESGVVEAGPNSGMIRVSPALRADEKVAVQVVAEDPQLSVFGFGHPVLVLHAT